MDNKKDEIPKSPSRLEKPKIPRSTLQKRPAIMIFVVMACVGLFIVYNVVNHSNESKKVRKTASENSNLIPATDYVNAMVNKVPDTQSLIEQKSAGMTSLNASSQIALPPTMPPLQPPAAVELDKQQSVDDEEKEHRFKAALQAGSSVQQFEGMDHVKPMRSNANTEIIAPQNTNSSGWSSQASASSQHDPNKQSEKRNFLQKLPSQNSRYLGHTREKALSPLEIKTGTIIPATMIDGINSDLPGDIIAQVSENVYDTASGRYLLIPQGARLFGTYDSQVTYGQNGVLIVWRRIIYPDGSTLEIENMGGSDQGGYAGFRDKVNNHYTRTFGFGLLTSLFSAAFQLSQPQEQTENGTISPQQTIAAAVGQNMTQLGIDLARKNMNVQPTIIIRNGYRFVVKVNHDILFPETYQL